MFNQLKTIVLFSTHPPAEERIRNLVALASAYGQKSRPFEQAWALRTSLAPKKPQRI